MGKRKGLTARDVLSFLLGGLFSRSLFSVGRIVLILLVVLTLRVYAWWLALPYPLRALGVALAVVAVLGWVVWRLRRRRAGRELVRLADRRREHRGITLDPALSIPRTIADPWWVYVWQEARDRRDNPLTLDEAMHMPPSQVVWHLVYIGRTNDLDRRTAEHAEVQPWWHDHMDLRKGYRLLTADDAVQLEAFLLAEAARPDKPLNERPRENRMLNPTYDPERSRYMLEKARARWAAVAA